MTIAGVEPVFVDTNVLVYASWQASPLHTQARAALAAYRAGDYALRGADATFVAVAIAESCTLVSLDREQRERAAPVVTTATPDEALAILRAAAQ